MNDRFLVIKNSQIRLETLLIIQRPPDLVVSEFVLRQVLERAALPLYLLDGPSSYDPRYPPLPEDTGVIGVAVTVGVTDGSGVSVGDGTSVVGIRVADGVGVKVEVGKTTSKVKVGEAVQVGVFTEDVLVATFGTLIGFPEAMKVELPRQFARCKSATVTR